MTPSTHRASHTRQKIRQTLRHREHILNIPLRVAVIFLGKRLQVHPIPPRPHPLRFVVQPRTENAVLQPDPIQCLKINRVFPHKILLNFLTQHHGTFLQKQWRRTVITARSVLNHSGIIRIKIGVMNK